MKSIGSTIILLLASSLATIHANEIIVDSLDRPGMLTFEEVPDAIRYRVEWTHDVTEGWTNFAGDTGQWMDAIPTTGTGTVTVAVPMFYRVVAEIPPTGMVFIPAGAFVMGNSTNAFPESEGSTNELPQHEVYTDAFFCDKYEVTEIVYAEICWATAYLVYSFSGSYPSILTNEPIDKVNWYDAVKWCNARSEAEALTPVYYTDAAFSNVYRSGEIEPFVDWTAEGYRLPTEAEWEKAARGGIPDTRFPWNDYTNKISHEKANYYAISSFPYDLSQGTHPLYGGNSAPVGSFSSNSYGVYDMAGNVMEWCWYWFDETYYEISPALNPKGPPAGLAKVHRGGDAYAHAPYLRCSSRLASPPPAADISIGFRCVRRAEE